jgi:hypothetical protein
MKKTTKKDKAIFTPVKKSPYKFKGRFKTSKKA